MKFTTIILTTSLIASPVVIATTTLAKTSHNLAPAEVMVVSHIPSVPMAKAIYDLIPTLKKQSPEAGKWQDVALKEYYQRHDYNSVWFDEDGNWKRNAKAFFNAMKEADKEGLNPKDYHFAKVANRVEAAKTVQKLAIHDVQLTNGLLHYIRDLSIGRAQPSESFPLLFLLPQKRNYATMLESILAESDADDIAAAFRKLAPNHEDYTQLRSALVRYKNVAETIDNWPKITDEGVIRPDESDARMPQIRQRMQLLGRLKGQRDIFDNLKKQAKAETKDELKEEITALKTASTPKEKKAAQKAMPDNPAWIYDDVTEKAIRRFQEINGAKVDGVIGPKTIKELNTPMKDRIRQIELSMERWRWLPESLGRKYVLTNIAGFYTEAVENGKLQVRSPVIVGQVAHQTPAFSSYITNVKFYPDWSAPSSIAKRYVLPKIKADPGVINSLGYEIYNGNQKLDWSSININTLTNNDFPPYRFRQKPGPKNALGMVRFSIDNDYSIYMHDTPNHELFDKEDRTFSSGCIRVKKSEDMAVFLLDANSDIDAATVLQKFAVTGGDLKSETHPLTQKVPAHLVYMTAWVGPEGDIKFGQDIYGRDAKLAKALIRQEGEL